MMTAIVFFHFIMSPPLFLPRKLRSPGLLNPWSFLSYHDWGSFQKRDKKRDRCDKGTGTVSQYCDTVPVPLSHPSSVTPGACHIRNDCPFVALFLILWNFTAKAELRSFRLDRKIFHRLYFSALYIHQ